MSDITMQDIVIQGSASVSWPEEHEATQEKEQEQEASEPQQETE